MDIENNNPPTKKQKTQTAKLTKKDLMWEKNFGALMEYKIEHGHCNVPQICHSHPKLGRWVNWQRYWATKGEITPERHHRLTELGFEWTRQTMTPDDLWDTRFQQILEYRNVHGDVNCPANYPPNPLLGQWVHTNRKQYKSGKMRRDSVERLEEIGFQWDRVRSRGGGGGRNN